MNIDKGLNFPNIGESAYVSSGRILNDRTAGLGEILRQAVTGLPLSQWLA